MHPWLFADVDSLRAISRHMQHASSAMGLGYFVTAVCSIVAIWLAYQWVEGARLRQAAEAQTVESLFQELCQAHRLSRIERQHLQKAAEELPPADLCSIFMDPRILGRLAMAGSTDADHFAKLSGKLFGDGRG